MANKLIKRRYNNLLTARNNYFGNGGDAGNTNNTPPKTPDPSIFGKVENLGAFLPEAEFKSEGELKPFDIYTQHLKNNAKLLTPTFTPIKDPKAEQKGALINAAGAAVGQIGGGLIGGGLQSGAGSVFQGLSSVAAAIPGPWGAVACLCEGQRVITRDGRFVNIEDLTPDDGIIGFSEQTNSVSPQTTTLQMLELYKPCVRIELQSGLNLECSTDHPVYIADSGRATRKYVGGIRTRVKTYSYVKAENIKVGQYAGVIDEVPIFGNLNVEKAYLIGMLIGDGSYTKRSIVALHTGDEDTWNYVESNNYGVVVNRFDPGERYSKEFRTYRIIDGCQMMRELGLYGQSKSTKTLPNNIHLWNKESIANLIAGLWDTDGYVTIESNGKKKHRICFCQSNLSLIRAVQEQLIKFGIHSSIKINKPKKGVIKDKQVNSKEAYVLIIKDKKSCMRFTENIHLNIGYKQRNLDKIKEIIRAKFTKDNSFRQGIHADKIISITPIGVQRIYNLEAHQDHNYIANFIVTHNSAGLGLVGGLTNRMFGSKMNTENIAKVEANINNLKNFQSDASDFDTLSQTWGNTAMGTNFANSYIGKDGWFSSKAKNKAKALRTQMEQANALAQSTLENNANNIGLQQANMLEQNYAAYGGPLLFSDGGSIHIKPENRGKFTETKRRTGKTTEELTHSKNPVTRKRAIFAQNARKWHHAFGGDLMTHGADFDTGFILVGNGGTHEENPYEGVPMGVDSEGVPNLVEEGEVIFNDYVFSNRLKVPKAVKKKYKLRGTKPLTFADAAIQMSKESEERPNDPISQAGLEDSMMKLMIEQEKLRTKRGDNNSFAKGGKMGRIYAGEEDDPYSQILNLERGPLNPIMWTLRSPTKNLNNGLFTKNPKSPLTKSLEYIPLLDFTLTDPTIKKPGITLPSIINSQSIISPQKTKYVFPQTKERNPYINPKKYEGPKLAPTGMRYLPAYASGIMSITDALGLTNKPDYGEAEAMLEASKAAGTYTPIKFNPVGNYLTYRPFDRDFYTNKLNAESSAARRALLNTSGGNRAQALAGILAADYNAQGKMGDLFRQAEEYNLAQRQKVEEFNRATNMANSEGILKADQANQSAQLQARSSYLKGALTAAELRQKERQAATAARSANLSNFINSLGDIGRENYQRNMIITDPSKYYSIGPNGEVIYKNSFNDLPQEYQDYITGYANRKSKSKKSKGGYLTIRRK